MAETNAEHLTADEISGLIGWGLTDASQASVFDASGRWCLSPGYPAAIPAERVDHARLCEICRRWITMHEEQQNRLRLVAGGARRGAREDCPAADELAAETGQSCDVLDLRSIFPYDWKAISDSVRKTGRVLIVNEDTEVTNYGEHLLRRVIDEHFYDLLVRPRLVAGKHVPGIGLNQVYEQNTVPQSRDVKDTLRAVLSEAA